MNTQIVVTRICYIVNKNRDAIRKQSIKMEQI